jgi:hypothetical protein
MKVGVIQSNYIPWRGYFDFIDSVDVFVIYDDVQYSKGSWRNRNQLKFSDGLKWITLPVKVNLGMNINEVKLKDDSWKKSHRDMLKASLGKAPYFKEAMMVWEEGVEPVTDNLSVLNENVIKSICRYLEIKTKIIRSEPYQLSGTKTERLMELFNHLSAKSYLSGPAAETYLDVDLFRKHNIDLIYKSYKYKPYPQQFDHFEPAVTVLDLIANTGKESLSYIKSTEPDLEFLNCQK